MAIMGASGSGKSTLLSIVAGLDMPTSGSVSIDGNDLLALDEDARAKFRGKRMSIVFQNFQLLPHLTALENIMLPLELSGKADAKSSAMSMLERVGLSQRFNHYPKTLSGGEQQRVALARAFVGKPLILFADEPTGSLDQFTGTQVMQLMMELNREYGTTLMIATHDTQVAKQCQHHFFIVDGVLRPSPQF